ncbi:MAG TPA: hypothetical protein VFZ54_17810 [Burkholderiales bacterium]
MFDKLRFQPGWSTPIEVDYRKPSFLAWLLGFETTRARCRARRQGHCPGLDQCHDCTWSDERSGA